ncbi:MAG: hypothetical protein HYY24_23445 [Verrucomicrobia bacterium]|nr:hypothetical protein [Verrucomicrobiota bacterium]
MRPIASEEPLARFLISSRHFSRGSDRVKADALIPHLFVELSVYPMQGLVEAEVWSIGDTVARPQGRTLHGRAEVLAEVVVKLCFGIVPAEPPPLHAHITGWPTDDRGAQRIRAVELAAAAKLILREQAPLPTT